MTLALGESVPCDTMVNAVTRPWTNALRMPLDRARHRPPLIRLVPAATE
ncbi:hypothetical protein [Streptomyces antibioticus]